jgi:DNA-directed RNA polymerase subunit RPC12/RpoP
MSIGARCGSCSRELLLGQLVQPSDGFRCPFCKEKLKYLNNRKEI